MPTRPTSPSSSPCSPARHHRRRPLHPHAPRRRRQPPGLQARRLQRGLRPYPAHEDALARRLHPRRRPRLPHHFVRNVLLRGCPGQVGREEAQERAHLGRPTHFCFVLV